MIVSNINIEVEYKKIKNIHLAVYPPDARVHVSAPDYVSEEDLRVYLITKTPWIQQQQKEILGQERETRREYISGENHYLFGKRYILRVIEEDAPPHIICEGKYMKMYVRPDSTREKRMEVMHEFYREQLQKKLEDLFPVWSSKMGESDFTWKILSMKTQWGSCMHDKRIIRMNLALARVPTECIEYIIVHEMAHLKVRLHNKMFDTLVSMYLPSWKKLRQLLNDFVSMPMN